MANWGDHDMLWVNMFCVQVEALLAKYEWITTDRRYFGQPNTAYDFGANDPKEVARRLTKLQEQKVGPLMHVAFLLGDLVSWGMALDFHNHIL